MPSAEKSTSGAVKLESAPNEPKNSDPNNSDEKNAPLISQVISIISNKVRNLEKRKNKLDGYLKEEESGKELSSEQQKAVSKYDEVTQQLNLSKEFFKQFQAIATAASKDAKREARKMMFTRQNQETTKVRDVLMIQDLLQRLRVEQVRSDFLNQRNGACPVDKAEMEFIDKFAQHVVPTRPSFSNQPTFEAAARASAEHFSNLIDGRTRPFLDTGVTYEKAKELFTRIQSCGYWEKDVKFVEAVEEIRKETETPNSDDLETKEGHVEVVEKAVPLPVSAPAPTQVPTPAFNGNVNMMPIPQQQQQMMARMAPQQLQQQKPLPETPTNVQMSMKHNTVTAVENAYFNQMKFSQPHQAQMVAANGLPIVPNEFGAGNFSFLQDSEIDAPAPGAPGSQQSHQQKMPVNVNQVKQPQPTQQQLQQLPNHTFKNANSNFHPQSQITTAGQMYPPGLKVQQQQMPNSVSHIPVNFQASPQQQNTVSSPQVPTHMIPKQQPQPVNANRINQISPFGAQTPPMTQQQQQAAYPLMPSNQKYQQQQQIPQNLPIEQKQQVMTPKMDGSGDSGGVKSTLDRDSAREDKQREEYQQQPQIDTWTNETAAQSGGSNNFSSRNSGGGGFNRNNRSSGGTGGGAKYNNYRNSQQAPRNYENGSGDSPRDGSAGGGTFFRNNERFNGSSGGGRGGFDGERRGGGGGGNYKSRDGNFRAGSGRFAGSAATQGSSNPSQRK